MVEIVGIDLERAKNWTSDRPFTIEPSIQKASGKGSRNLYSREDLYRMALAYSLSTAGMSGAAIGKVLEAVQARCPDGLAGVEWLTAWRMPKKQSSPESTGEEAKGHKRKRESAGFEIRLSRREPPANRLVHFRVNVKAVVERVDAKIGKGG
jgi:DNA-binding transcriptional MerR regulator